MANYRRTATGNWSTLAQWQDDGGGSYTASTVLPGPSDVVYANNFTVTLDVNVTVLELRNNTATNINAGGVFTFGAGNTVIANIYAGTSTCLRNETTNTKTVIGNGFSGSANSPFAVQNSWVGVINMTGNLFGGIGGNQPWGGANTSTGIFNFTGNATGGAGSNATGITNDSTGTVNVIGDVIGGSGVNARGAENRAAGTLIVTNAIASTVNAGISGNNSAGTTIIRSVTNGANGRMGAEGFVKFTNAGPNTFTVTRQDNTTQTLVDSSIGNPPTTDVRDGVSYASGALTGTLKVPPSSSVAVGVPVDNTTGTAIITVTDMGALLTSFKIS